jgi:hypothetical protein
VHAIFNSKKLAVITLFGTLAFVSNGFLPSPIDKIVIGIQALCFSLAALVVPKGGATYASFVTGLLLSVLRPGFFPFSLLFSVFYGVMIELSFYCFKVNCEKCIKTKRLILLLTVVTGITGVTSMYLTTIMGILPMIPAIYIAIVVVGCLNGAIAGYLNVKIWRNHLSHFL